MESDAPLYFSMVVSAPNTDQPGLGGVTVEDGEMTEIRVVDWLESDTGSVPDSNQPTALISAINTRTSVNDNILVENRKVKENDSNQSTALISVIATGNGEVHLQKGEVKDKEDAKQEENGSALEMSNVSASAHDRSLVREVMSEEDEKETAAKSELKVMSEDEKETVAKSELKLLHVDVSCQRTVAESTVDTCAFDCKLNKDSLSLSQDHEESVSKPGGPGSIHDVSATPSSLDSKHRQDSDMQVFLELIQDFRLENENNNLDSKDEKTMDITEGEINAVHVFLLEGDSMELDGEHVKVDRPDNEVSCDVKSISVGDRNHSTWDSESPGDDKEALQFVVILENGGTTELSLEKKEKAALDNMHEHNYSQEKDDTVINVSVIDTGEGISFSSEERPLKKRKRGRKSKLKTPASRPSGVVRRKRGRPPKVSVATTTRRSPRGKGFIRESSAENRNNTDGASDYSSQGTCTDALTSTGLPDNVPVDTCHIEETSCKGESSVVAFAEEVKSTLAKAPHGSLVNVGSPSSVKTTSRGDSVDVMSPMYSLPNQGIGGHSESDLFEQCNTTTEETMKTDSRDAEEDLCKRQILSEPSVSCKQEDLYAALGNKVAKSSGNVWIMSGNGEKQDRERVTINCGGDDYTDSIGCDDYMGDDWAECGGECDDMVDSDNWQGERSTETSRTEGVGNHQADIEDEPPKLRRGKRKKNMVTSSISDEPLSSLREVKSVPSRKGKKNELERIGDKKKNTSEGKQLNRSRRKRDQNSKSKLKKQRTRKQATNFNNKNNAASDSLQIRNDSLLKNKTDKGERQSFRFKIKTVQRRSGRRQLMRRGVDCYAKSSDIEGILTAVESMDTKGTVMSEESAVGSMNGTSKNPEQSKYSRRKEPYSLKIKMSKSFTCEVCGKQFLTKANLKRHKVTHTKKKCYDCLICNQTFSSKYALRKHHRAKHKTDAGLSSEKTEENGSSPGIAEACKCDQCGRTFAKYDQLVRHKNRKHALLVIEDAESQLFQCMTCRAGFKSQSLLEIHARSHRSLGTIRVVAGVGEEGDTKVAVTLGAIKVEPGETTGESHAPTLTTNSHNHRKDLCQTDSNTDVNSTCVTTSAGLCSQGASDISSSVQSSADVSSKGAIKGSLMAPLEATSAPELSPESGARLVSRRPCQQGGAHLCPICGKQYASSSSLGLHKRSVHEKMRKYHCQKCPKRFQTATDLKRHGYRHSEQYPFNCETCGKGFTRQSELQAHTNVHTGVRRHVCSYCGIGFTLERFLVKHIANIHVANKLFNCGICGKGFTCHYSLRRHMSGHEQKTHRCDICGKFFVSTEVLAQHKKKHTGKRDIKCPKCDKLFASQESLRYHLPAHRVDGKFTCEVCNKDFPNDSRLTAHMRTHKAVYKFSCDLCSFQARSLSQIQKHRNSTIHSLERKFECKDCGKWYVRKSVLDEHRRRMHNV